jgi:hypothetical protein
MGVAEGCEDKAINEMGVEALECWDVEHHTHIG